jgi:hypothetical protein
MARTVKWIKGLCLCLLLTCCTGAFPGRDDAVINDFETDGDLDRIDWRCHTLLTLSDIGVSHGRSSVKMVMTPALYPGIAFEDFPKNWSGYESLSATFFNPGKKDVNIVLRIDDKRKSPEYRDRVNQEFPVTPGFNRLVIPMSRLVCPSGRPLETRHIFNVAFFTVKPPETVVLYLDDVRLNAPEKSEE